MADTITSGTILAVGLEYTDINTAKIRTTYLKVPSPKNNLTESQIKAAVSQLITGEEPILKDTYGNAFSESAIATAYTESTEEIDIDIDVE